MKWLNYTEQKPDKEGFYAIMYCFGPTEGFLPDSDYWDGKKWDSNLPVCLFSSQIFDDYEAAGQWANDNDIEDC